MQSPHIIDNAVEEENHICAARAVRNEIRVYLLEHGLRQARLEVLGLGDRYTLSAVLERGGRGRLWIMPYNAVVDRPEHERPELAYLRLYASTSQGPFLIMPVDNVDDMAGYLHLLGSGLWPRYLVGADEALLSVPEFMDRIEVIRAAMNSMSGPATAEGEQSPSGN